MPANSYFTMKFLVLIVLCWAVASQASTLVPWLQQFRSKVSPFVCTAVEELFGAADADMAIELGKRFKVGQGNNQVVDVIGVVNSEVRAIAKKTYKDSRESHVYSIDDALAVMETAYMEQRLLGLFLLQHLFDRAHGTLGGSQGRFSEPHIDTNLKKHAWEEREEIVEVTLDRIPSHIDNWKLVDYGVPPIVGEYALAMRAKRPLLHRLSLSPNLWKRRAAVLSSWPLIKAGEFQDFETISRRLLHDPEELVRTVNAWLLREAGKYHPPFLTRYLEVNGRSMPRSMAGSAAKHCPKTMLAEAHVPRRFTDFKKRPSRRKTPPSEG